MVEILLRLGATGNHLASLEDANDGLGADPTLPFRKSNNSRFGSNLETGVGRRLEKQGGNGDKPAGPYGKGYPRGKKKKPTAVWGVARPQGVEGSGMAGPGETLRSPWIPLPVRACKPVWHGVIGVSKGVVRRTKAACLQGVLGVVA
jgi:hypothetical protein